MLSKFLRILIPLVACVALFATPGHAQCPSQTPNLGLQIPNLGNTTTWGVCINEDLSELDSLLGGVTTLLTGTTPTINPVSGQATNYVTANTSATVITNILGGFPGQTIRLFCGASDTSTSIATSASISVNGTWSCPTSGAISLTLLSGIWHENSREVGSGGGGGGSTPPCTTTALSPQYNLGGTFGCIDFLSYNAGTHTLTGAGGGILNLGAISSIKLPFASSFSTSSLGQVGFDITHNNWHLYNGADAIGAVFSNLNPTNGDCPQIQNSGGTLSLIDYGSPCNVYIDVQSQGAKPDAKIVTDGAMTSGGTFTLTSATAAFTSGDVGKSLWLISAAGNLVLFNSGCNGGTNNAATTIATFVNSTTVTLAGEYCGSSGALTGMTVTYGTDDTSAFSTTFGLSVTGNSCMTIHAGSYIVSAPWVSLIGVFQCILGAGHGLVNIYHSPAINWSTYAGSAFYNFQGGPTFVGVNLQAQGMVQGSFTNVSLLQTPGARFTDLYATGFNFPSSNVIFNLLGDDDVASQLVAASDGGIGVSVHSNYFECYSCRFGSSNTYGVQVQDGGHQEFFGGIIGGTGAAFDVLAGSGSVAQGVIYGTVLCANNNGSAFQMETPAGSFTSEYKIVNSYLNQYTSITCGTGPAVNVTGIKILGASGRNVLTVSGNTIGSTGTGVAISNADTLFESGVDNLNGNGAIANTGSWTSNPQTIPGVSLTGQTSSIGSTSAYTTTKAGLWEAQVDLLNTTAGTGGTVTASIINNNGVGTNTQTTSTLSLTGSGEIPTAFRFYSPAGQNLNYSTTVSGASGSPIYALRIRWSYLGP